MSRCLICGRKLGTFDERECYSGGCASHKRKSEMKTFESYCESRNKQLNCLIPCAECERLWYKSEYHKKESRIKELEAQIERLKNYWNCKHCGKCSTVTIVDCVNCPCENWQEREVVSE